MGEEFCLLREHARRGTLWTADGDEGGGGGEGGAGGETGAQNPPPPPPLPPDLEALVSAARRSPAGAEAMLVRMEECHVLLSHALRRLRRLCAAWGDGGGAALALPPGAASLMSPTLAAFAHPRFPFRVKTRRRALRLVAAFASATRRAIRARRSSSRGSRRRRRRSLERRRRMMMTPRDENENNNDARD